MTEKSPDRPGSAEAIKLLKEVPFRLIVITPAENLPGEEAIIRELFAEGLGRLHVRKPGMTGAGMRAYLDFFTDRELAGIRVHCTGRVHRTGRDFNIGSDPSTGGDSPEPALAGLHLPYPELCKSTTQTAGTSTSIHAWEEYDSLPAGLDYVFMGPLFNSISKKGYRRNPGTWKLPLNRKVPIIGLGGVNSGNILKVRQAGFSGAALLGAIWERPAHAAEVFREIRNSLEQECL